MLCRTLANDNDPAAVVGAYAELYRVLNTNRFCISFYGYPKLDAFVYAWTEAGFDTVGHIAWPNPGRLSSERTEAIIAPMSSGKPTRPSAVMAASPQEMNTIEQARRLPDRAFTATIAKNSGAAM